MLYIQPCLTAYPEFSVENSPRFTSNHINTMVMSAVHFSTVPNVFLSVLPLSPLRMEEISANCMRQWTQIAAREISVEYKEKSTNCKGG